MRGNMPFVFARELCILILICITVCSGTRGRERCCSRSQLERIKTTQEAQATQLQEMATELSNVATNLEELTGRDLSHDKKCPEEFIKYNSSCYFFGVLPVSRQKAALACRRAGAYLVEVNDYIEDQFISNTKRSFNDVSGIGFYTGGHNSDPGNYGSWKWERSQEPVTYTRWYEDSLGPDEDSNDPPLLYNDPYLYYGLGLRRSIIWASGNGVDPKGFICELSL